MIMKNLISVGIPLVIFGLVCLAFYGVVWIIRDQEAKDKLLPRVCGVSYARDITTQGMTAGEAYLLTIPIDTSGDGHPDMTVSCMADGNDFLYADDRNSIVFDICLKYIGQPYGWEIESSNRRR